MGSRSAQTINESQQEGAAYIGGGVSISKWDLAFLQRMGTKRGDKKLKVHHRWKPNNKLWGITTSHHSHIQVNDESDTCWFHVGMFNVGGTATVLRRLGQVVSSSYTYHDSKSYKPNPIDTTGEDLYMAFDYAVFMCSKDYNLLKNNCQKFARILMTQLGAKHHRNMFHP